MIFILSQLIVVAIFLLVGKLRELICNQNTYIELLKEDAIKSPVFRQRN
jgi:hypothetical protein